MPPADTLDAVVWCAFGAATAFVLALYWALEFTARGGIVKDGVGAQPTLSAEQYENLRLKLRGRR